MYMYMHLNHAYMCDELSYHTELCFQFYTCQEKHCVRIEHGSRSLDAEHAVALFFLSSQSSAEVADVVVGKFVAAASTAALSRNSWWSLSTNRCPDAVLDVQLCRCAKVLIFICMWIPVVVTDYCFWYSMVVVQLSTRYRPISADNETHIQALSRPWWSLGASSVALSFTSLDSWSEPRAMVNQNGDVAICCHGFIIMLTRIYTILCILYKEILRIFMHRNHSNMIKHIFCCCGVVHPKWTLTSLRGCAVCRKRCGRTYTYAVWSNLLGIWNIQVQVSLVKWPSLSALTVASCFEVCG